MTLRPGLAARWAASAVLVVTCAACGTASAERSESRPTEATEENPATPTTRIPTPDTPRYVPDAPVLDVAAPAQLEIPAIGVSTPLIPLGLVTDGSLAVPTDFAQAGWYTGGPKPGESGPSVVAGHVDSVDGPAVFYRLGDLQRGDAITVQRVDGTEARFVVDRLERFEKQAFPTETVFGPTVFPELRLVTCGGDFDFEHRTYLENLVVFAHPA